MFGVAGHVSCDIVLYRLSVGDCYARIWKKRNVKGESRCRQLDMILILSSNV
jgi:hypothetical protein